MHERQWRRADRSREPRDAAIDRRAIEIMEHLRCNWLEAWARARAEQRIIDGQGDVDLEKREPAQHRLRHPGRMTLSEQIGRAMPPRPGTTVPGRTTLAAALPAAVMRSAEHAEIDPAAAELVARARRGGAPLDDVLRPQLETALGTQLDDVRVHIDAEADAAARAIGARAFAVGDDVFFRDGAYDPQQHDGQRLIAHEVVHTVQARGAAAPTDGTTTVSQPGDAPEREADAFADEFVRELHGASRTIQSPASSRRGPTPSPVQEAVASTNSLSSASSSHLIYRDPVAPGQAGQGDPAAFSQLQGLLTRAGLPAGQQQFPNTTLTIADATRILNLLLRSQPSLVAVGPRMVAARIMQEVVIGGADTSITTVAQRLAAFRPIIILRPDGYIARAVSGEAIQRAGRTEVLNGVLQAGGLSMGTFYYSDGGVFYRTNDGLQRTGPPIGELGLEHDAVNSALDGVADALVGMATGLYQLIRHPIDSIAALRQLPGAIAQLIENAPEYWERFRAMPMNDQIREVSKIVTTLLTLYGTAAGTTTRLAAAAGDLGNVTIHALTLSANGELALATVAVPVGTVATALSGGPGAVYILHMSNSSLNNNSGGGGGSGAGSGGGGRLIVPAGRTLSAEETAIANQLVAEGRTVEAVAEASVRTADFLVDGVKTELKSISNITSSDPSGALGRRILEGAGQAPNIIADVRQQAGMTEELALRAARRAYGVDRAGRIQNIRLIGQGFDVTVPRLAAPPPAAP